MVKLSPFQGVPSLAPFQPPFLPSQKRSARLVAPFQPPFPAIPSLVSLVVPSYLQSFFT